MPRESEINFRKGSAAAWAAANPVLDLGEPGFENDTLKFKVGDGVTQWNLLRYVGLDGGVIDGGGEAQQFNLLTTASGSSLTDQTGDPLRTI